MTSGSYGQAFNEGHGGVFATWLDSNALRIYWWSRDKVPSDITSGNPDPSTWGTPASQFVSGSGCNVDNYFKKQTIVGLVLAELSFLLFVDSFDLLDYQHDFLRRQHQSVHLGRQLRGFNWYSYMR